MSQNSEILDSLFHNLLNCASKSSDQSSANYSNTNVNSGSGNSVNEYKSSNNSNNESAKIFSSIANLLNHGSKSTGQSSVNYSNSNVNSGSNSNSNNGINNNNKSSNNSNDNDKLISSLINLLKQGNESTGQSSVNYSNANVNSSNSNSNNSSVNNNNKNSNNSNNGSAKLGDMKLNDAINSVLGIVSGLSSTMSQQQKSKETTKPTTKPTSTPASQPKSQSNSTMQMNDIKRMTPEELKVCKRFINYLITIRDIIPNTSVINHITETINSFLNKEIAFCDGTYLGFKSHSDFNNTNFTNSLEIISSLINDRGVFNELTIDFDKYVNSNKRYLSCVFEFTNFKEKSRDTLCHNILDLLETIKTHSPHYPNLYKYLRSYIQQHKDFVDEIDIRNVPFVFDGENDCEMCVNCLRSEGVHLRKGSHPHVVYFDLTVFNPISSEQDLKENDNYGSNRVPTPIPTEDEILDKSRIVQTKPVLDYLSKPSTRLPSTRSKSNISSAPQRTSQQSFNKSTSKENSTSSSSVSSASSTVKRDNFLDEYAKIRDMTFDVYIKTIFNHIKSNIDNDNFTRIQIVLFDSISSQDPRNKSKYSKELESICSRLSSSGITANYCLREKPELISLSDVTLANNTDYLTINNNIIESLSDYDNCDRLINNILSKSSDNNDSESDNHDDELCNDVNKSSSNHRSYGTFEFPTMNLKSNSVTKSISSSKLFEGIINIDLSSHLNSSNLSSSNSSDSVYSYDSYDRNTFANYNYTLNMYAKNMIDLRIAAIFELAKEEIKADARNFINGNCEILVKCTSDTLNDYELINTRVSAMLNNLSTSSYKLNAIPIHKQEGDIHVYSINVNIA